MGHTKVIPMGHIQVRGKIPTNNYWANRTKNGHTYNPIAVCLHITDSSFQSAKNWIQNPDSYVSYNYLLDERGEAYEVVHPSHAAWANGLVVNPTWKRLQHDSNGYTINPNLYTISIAIANQGLFPNIQAWKKWVKFVKSVCEEHSFPINDLYVIDHRDIRANKSCPGMWFNKQWLKILQNVW